jgi:hypothetical protein
MSSLVFGFEFVKHVRICETAGQSYVRRLLLANTLVPGIEQTFQSDKLKCARTFHMNICEMEGMSARLF